MLTMHQKNLVAVFLAAAVVGWAAPISARFAPQDDARNFVLQMYQRYYQRTPNNAEVAVWLNGFRRGDSLEDIHASFIGSDEYFVKCNRNYTNWLDGMYWANLNREPTQNEASYWLNRLVMAGNDRRTVAREFLRTIQHGNAQIPVGNQPATGALGDLARQLLTNSQLLSQNIRSEGSGFAGTLLQIQANALLQQAQQAQNAYWNANNDAQAARNAYNRVDNALQGLASAIRGQVGLSNSLYYLSQVTRIHQAIGERLPSVSGPGFGPVYPPYYPPSQEASLTRQQARSLSRANDTAARRFESFYSLVSEISYQDYRYRLLANDVGAVTASLQANGNQIREGLPISQLLNQVRPIDCNVRNLSERIRNNTVDLRVSQSWYDCARAYDEFAEQLNRLQGGSSTGGPRDPWDLQATLRWIDRSIDQCDVMINQYSRFYLNGSGNNRFVMQLRNLKNSLVVLRLHLTQNADRATLLEDWQTVRDNFQLVGSTYPGGNQLTRSTAATDMDELNNSMDQLGMQLNALGQ